MNTSSWKVFDTRKDSKQKIQAFLDKHTHGSGREEDPDLKGMFFNTPEESCRIHMATPFIIIEVIQTDIYA